MSDKDSSETGSTLNGNKFYDILIKAIDEQLLYGDKGKNGKDEENSNDNSSH